MYTYSFFVLRTEIHVSRMQIKFCHRCPHQMKCWTGLP